MKCDVAILAVVPKTELGPLLSAFGIDVNQQPDHDSIWKTSIRSNSSRRQLEVCIGIVGEQGNSDAAAAASWMISHVSPTLIFLVGTAGGDPRTVKLGSVVVAKLVVNYEGSKLTPEGPRPRHDREEVDEPLRAQLELFDARAVNTKWPEYFEVGQNLIPVELRPRTSVVPSSCFKFIAAGEKILSDGTLPKFADTHDDRIVACDKESFGFAVAAKKHRCFWAVVRGVSDFADPQTREGTNKDLFHLTASNAAATFVRTFLMEGLDIDGLLNIVKKNDQDLFSKSPHLVVNVALISVQDKTGIVEFAKFLTDRKVLIVATPGVRKLLNANDIPSVSTWEFTSTAPLLHYRASLHPYLLASIEVDPRDPQSMEQLDLHRLQPISLVVCNFKPTLPLLNGTSADTFKQLALMQEGVPLLLRWCIRCWNTCATVVSHRDYPSLMSTLSEHSMSIPHEVRLSLLRRTLHYVGDRDAHTVDLCESMWPKV